jgi:hypothetical protein
MFYFPFDLFNRMIRKSGVLDSILLKNTDVEIDLMSVKN